MSSHVNGPAMPRFELPKLDLNFGSITDGTNIPPPPPPEALKVPTPPQTPRLAGETGEADAATLNGNANGTGSSASANGNIANHKPTADGLPLSPAASTRQGSLRRLFSKNMLNANYTDGNSNSLEYGSRPPSRSASSTMGGRKSRRNSWFKFFRGGESKRSSILFEDIIPPKEHAVSPPQPPPPPPMIPELKEFDKDEGSLGSDLFKNIE